MDAIRNMLKAIHGLINWYLLMEKWYMLMLSRLSFTKLR